MQEVWTLLGSGDFFELINNGLTSEFDRMLFKSTYRYYSTLALQNMVNSGAIGLNRLSDSCRQITPVGRSVISSHTTLDENSRARYEVRDIPKRIQCRRFHVRVLSYLVCFLFPSRKRCLWFSDWASMRFVYSSFCNPEIKIDARHVSHIDLRMEAIADSIERIGISYTGTVISRVAQEYCNSMRNCSVDTKAIISETVSSMISHIESNQVTVAILTGRTGFRNVVLEYLSSRYSCSSILIQDGHPFGRAGCSCAQTDVEFIYSDAHRDFALIHNPKASHVRWSLPYIQSTLVSPSSKKKHLGKTLVISDFIPGLYSGYDFKDYCYTIWLAILEGISRQGNLPRPRIIVAPKTMQYSVSDRTFLKKASNYTGLTIDYKPGFLNNLARCKGMTVAIGESTVVFDIQRRQDLDIHACVFSSNDLVARFINDRIMVSDSLEDFILSLEGI